MSEERNPFQSPETSNHVGGASAVVPFESGHLRAIWTIGFLVCVAVTNIISAGSNYLLYKSVIGGDVRAIESSGGAVGWANNLAMVGAIIAFSMWTHRVYRNLPALGAQHLRYTPGWAVGWLFIPFANLVIPYFVFAEIWKNSLPVPANSVDGRGNRISPLLIGWWIVNVLPVVVLIVGFAALVVAMFNAAVVNAHEAIEPGKVAQSISDPLVPFFLLAAVVVPLIGSAAAILAIFVVRRVDRNQQAKHEMIRETGGVALNPDSGSVS